MPRSVLTLLAVTAALPLLASGFSPLALAPASLSRSAAGCTMMAAHEGRRSALSALGGAALGVLLGGQEAGALVKGVAPPEGYGKRKESTEKVTNMQDARELGAQKEKELFDKQGDAEIQRTKDNDRFRDITVGSGAEVKPGSSLDIKYRVLRLGKRSRDGLSGEASLIFSYGYGEDDDKETDVKSVVVGETNFIPALQESIIGMKEGGKRRISVRPERGWRLLDNTCAGAIDIGTAIGLPGGSVTEAEGCLDTFRVPSPTTYQAKRKLGRRFDETVLLEVEVVKVK